MRLGRFTASSHLAQNFDTYLKRVMGMCIIVRAEQMFVSDRIEYIAISEHFRFLTPGELPPEYRWIFTSDGEITCEELI